MSEIYFKASLQNTLNPEVGTFDNRDNKEGTFTLEDGEYYLTNKTSTSYGVYYPTKDMYSVGFTVEFDINYNYTSSFGWCLLFYGDDTYWQGFGIDGNNLEFRGSSTPGHGNDDLYFQLVKSPSTWLHVKCSYDYDSYQNINFVHIYIDNVEVKSFPISNNYGIKYIDILGNSGGFVPDGANIKNITIYDNRKHYLDTTGLTLLWSKIKSLFATKTELASKVNTSDLSNYYTKSGVVNLLSNYYTKEQIDIMLNNMGSDKYGMSITADESEGGDDTLGGLSFYTAVERAPGYDGTSQITIAEDSNTVEDE